MMSRLPTPEPLDDSHPGLKLELEFGLQVSVSVNSAAVYEDGYLFCVNCWWMGMWKEESCV